MRNLVGLAVPVIFAAVACGGDPSVPGPGGDDDASGDGGPQGGGGGVANAALCPPGAIRWASSPRRVYVTGPVVCTPTDLARVVSPDELELVSAEKRTWLLRANVVLERGATLRLHGRAAGGDVDELRLLSNDESGDDAIVYLRAEWGALDLDGVRVTSWDEDDGEPDRRPDRHGRAYIHVRSFLDADGVTVRSSRMDIRRSEVAYLGYDADEAYGLSWRVAGEGERLLERVGVTGEVTDSRIHHNWFGVYTWGAEGMVFARNEIDNNHQYGLDPHDDSDGLVVTDNDIHHNGSHGFICSKRCDGLRIAGNRVWGNGGSGILLHLDATDSLIEDNVSHHNDDAGIALVDASRNVIRGNRLHDNVRGLQLSGASADNLAEDNDLEASKEYGLYLFPGDDPQAIPGGRPMDNRFSGNRFLDNELALNVVESDGNRFEANVFDENDDGPLFQDARDNLLVDNLIPMRSVIVTKSSSSSRPATTIVDPAEMPCSVQAVGDAITVFRDAGRRIYRVRDVDDAPTRVTPGETVLTLGSEDVESPRTVDALPLWVELAAGGALVTPTAWSAHGGRRFDAQASSASVAARFVAGGLAPGAEHVVLRDGAPLVVVRADAAGQVAWQDVLDATPRGYAIAPR